MTELYPNPSNARFKIISQTGTEYFEEILKDDCRLMWDFIKKLCEKQQSIKYKQLRKICVAFNITKIS
ncbi:hypothetical protein C7Y66_22560 [Chroococcidiopsis sp. CCALA 051]|nr:hypothetical protein C7Y66_22560 [Chroococcidiopsis sp. CCALA 051]